MFRFLSSIPVIPRLFLLAALATGGYASGRFLKGKHSDLLVVAPVAQGSLEPKLSLDWEGIAGLSPTPEHRLLALDFFAAAIQQDQQATNSAWAAISELPAEKWLIWSKPDAVLRFLNLWLELDAEVAWKVIAELDDEETVSTLKALLRQINPVFFATIQPKKPKWSPAVMGLSPLDQLLTEPLSLVGLETASAAMKNQYDDGFKEIARALVDRDRAGAVQFLETNLHSQKPSMLFAELARQVFLTIAPGDLAEVKRLQQLAAVAQPNLFAASFFQLANRWDTQSLREAIPKLLADTAADGKFTAAALESLLTREPLTAVALLADHPSLEKSLPRSLELMPTLGQAKAAREAIEAAPESARAGLADAFRGALVENDIGFYLANAKPQPGEPLLNGEESATWLHRDLQAATTWMASQKAANWNGAAQTWVGLHPEACSAWVNSLPPGENRLQATAGLITGIARHDPEMASQWLATIPPEDRERRLASDILQFLNQRKP